MKTRAAARGDNEGHRAEILRQLVSFYPEPMTYNGLLQGMMISGHPMDEESRELDFHLAYLEESGYVKVARETRRGRAKILSVAATRKGVDLYDHRIPEDAGIAL